MFEFIKDLAKNTVDCCRHPIHYPLELLMGRKSSSWGECIALPLGLGLDAIAGIMALSIMLPLLSLLIAVGFFLFLGDCLSDCCLWYFLFDDNF